MFWHVVLGLLRDGKPRHGYELRTMYLKQSGTALGTGNFYRELTRLAAEGLVCPVANPPDADARRIPYAISEAGREDFDEWLLTEHRPHDDLDEWILFADRVPADARDRIVSVRLEDIWLRNKILARTRDEALRATNGRYAPSLASIDRQMKGIAAEIEFLESFRDQSATWDEPHATHDAPPTTSVKSSTFRARGRNPRRPS